MFFNTRILAKITTNLHIVTFLLHKNPRLSDNIIIIVVNCSPCDNNNTLL